MWVYFNLFSTLISCTCFWLGNRYSECSFVCVTRNKIRFKFLLLLSTLSINLARSLIECAERSGKRLVRRRWPSVWRYRKCRQVQTFLINDIYERKMAPKTPTIQKGYLYDAAHNLPINIPKSSLKRMQNASAWTPESCEADSGIFLNSCCFSLRCMYTYIYVSIINTIHLIYRRRKSNLR